MEYRIFYRQQIPANTCFLLVVRQTALVKPKLGSNRLKRAIRIGNSRITLQYQSTRFRMGGNIRFQVDPLARESDSCVDGMVKIFANDSVKVVRGVSAQRVSNVQVLSFNRDIHEKRGPFSFGVFPILKCRFVANM